MDCQNITTSQLTKFRIVTTNDSNGVDLLSNDYRLQRGLTINYSRDYSTYRTKNAVLHIDNEDMTENTFNFVIKVKQSQKQKIFSILAPNQPLNLIMELNDVTYNVGGVIRQLSRPLLHNREYFLLDIEFSQETPFRVFEYYTSNPDLEIINDHYGVSNYGFAKYKHITYGSNLNETIHNDGHTVGYLMFTSKLVNKEDGFNVSIGDLTIEPYLPINSNVFNNNLPVDFSNIPLDRYVKGFLGKSAIREIKNQTNIFNGVNQGNINLIITGLYDINLLLIKNYYII